MLPYRKKERILNFNFILLKLTLLFFLNENERRKYNFLRQNYNKATFRYLNY